MGSNAQGAVSICRCDWYTTIHCLGAEQRCLKTKINTAPNFLEMEKTRILDITKGYYIIPFSVKNVELAIFSSVRLYFWVFPHRTHQSVVCKTALPRYKGNCGSLLRFSLTENHSSTGPHYTKNTAQTEKGAQRDNERRMSQDQME